MMDFVSMERAYSSAYDTHMCGMCHMSQSRRKWQEIVCQRRVDERENEKKKKNAKSAIIYSG